MPNKMLIDASHREETRVVVTRGNRIEEFDFEAQDRKQLRGNIYLARVTRVEPSLQAAFVEYGGNRHGFLAFSEIHPDYYQIPVADRQALLKAEAEASEDEDDDEDEERGGRNRRRRRGKNGRNGHAMASENGDSDAEASPASTEDGEHGEGEDAAPQPAMAEAVSSDSVSEETSEDNGSSDHLDAPSNGSSGNGEDEVESVGAEDALDEVRTRRKPMRKQYKIQEVIKRRQIMLVQVVKEERGNKGAALTTYLSLAGRYSVLMPNTARGGGISRKITSVQDRKRLKDIVKDLDVPQGMGVILRTAGQSRTKAEVKRDYEYLMRMWENVRELTMKSIAPALVYEEGSLIKRSVRDLYNKDIDQILVAGDDGYREAKDFMRMLMPSHAKVVQPYRDTVPIFARNGIEAQLDKMLQPQVTLKSGGYIIINQTEALVAIDVNSGRSTREHSIEDTALQTNLEAAEEVARQLRLRDLAGLIVIDFIDMEENRNNRAVEKRLKDHLKNDRARIQVGRISHFGLLEMSRQRIRASVLDSTMQPCPHCGGSGHVRSDSSVGLMVVRGIEDYLLKDHKFNITVRTPTATALYVLNHKRAALSEMERRFGADIAIEADDSVGHQHFAITKGTPAEREPQAVITLDADVLAMDDEIDEKLALEAGFDEDEEETVEAVAEPAEQRLEQRSEEQSGENGDRKRKRRRRRRRGGRDRDGETSQAQGEDGNQSDEDEDGDEAEGSDDAGSEAEGDEAKAANGEGDRRKRRRGKRGGRRNRREDEGGEGQPAMAAEGEPADAVADDAARQAIESSADTVALAPAEVVEADQALVEPNAEEAPAKKKPTRRRKKADAEEGAAEAAAEPEEKPAKKPRKAPARKRAAAQAEEPETISAEPESEAPVVEATAEPNPIVEEPAAAEPVAVEPARPVEPVLVSSEPVDESKPRRTGWWRRK
jgi:ribonuclease E